MLSLHAMQPSAPGSDSRLPAQPRSSRARARWAWLALSWLLVACGDEERPSFVEPVYGDPCHFISCSGHGSCDAATGQPSCVCEEGYTGDRCDQCAARFHFDARGRCVPDRTCASEDADPCGEHGACEDEAGIIACECDRGYEGARCELCMSGWGRNDFGECLQLLLVNGEERLPPEQCTERSCHGNGLCAEEEDGSLTCSCAPGYTGVRCDLCAPGYATRDERCVLDVPCTASECGACDGFQAEPAFPSFADTCVSREALQLSDVTLTSLDGEGTVWLCAATTRYGLGNEHVVLEVGTSRSAQLAFRAPIAALSVDFAAGIFGAQDESLAFQVLGDGELIDEFDAARGAAGPLSFTFEPPIETFALRSRDLTTEVAIDNLAYELALCE